MGRKHLEVGDIATKLGRLRAEFGRAGRGGQGLRRRRCPFFHGTVEKSGGQVVVRGLQAVVALDGLPQIAFRFVKLAEADQTIAQDR